MRPSFIFGQQPPWPETLWCRNAVPTLLHAGITGSRLDWITLRRSLASLLLFKGASLRVSMELTLHSAPEMTLATYAPSVGDAKSAILAEWLISCFLQKPPIGG